MSKVKKVLLVNLILMILMSSLSAGIPGYINVVTAYSHKPNNILENVFKNDKLTILPFIPENSDEVVKKSYIVEQFKIAREEIQNISNLKDIIVTGDIIKTKSNTYTVVIYGDVNGDGYADTFDAQKILLHDVYGGEHTLKGIYLLAANVKNDDNEVDAFDAQRILKFDVGTEKRLVVNEPASMKETDKEVPVITLIGDNPQRLKVGEKYYELGAKVTDNIDKNLTPIIDTTNVDTSKEGTYVVTYNVTDSNGNKAIEVKRTVNVIDYIKLVEIDVNNIKKEYEVGDAIDLTGGKINITYASGKKESINITKDMITGYDSSEVGNKTVTVKYSTTNTIDDKNADYKVDFNVEVKEENVDVPQTIEATIYDDLTQSNGKEVTIATITSNKAITSKDFTYSITKNGQIIDNKDIANVVIVPTDKKVVTMSFVSIEEGTYIITVTPTVEGAESFNIKVNIEDTTSVKQIILDGKDVTGQAINISVREGEIIQPKISFKNVKGEELKDITLKRANISLTSSENVVVELEDEDVAGTIKELYIRGILRTDNPIKVSITVDDVKFDMLITVLEKDVTLKANSDNISLYTTKPDNVENLMVGIYEDIYEDDNDQIITDIQVYNLSQIYITENGINRKLKRKEITDNITIKVNGTEIKDAKGNNIMYIAAFDANKKKQGMKDNNNESEYLGIRISDNATNEQLMAIEQAGKITVEYKYNDKKILLLELNVTNVEIADSVEQIVIDGKEASQQPINISIREGEVLQPRIHFKNAKGEDLTNITLKRINVSSISDDNVIVELQDANGSTSGAIKKIYIRGIEKTNNSPIKVDIVVDDVKLELLLTVIEKETTLKVTGNNTIDLYKTKPNNSENMMIGIYEDIYEDDNDQLVTDIQVYNLSPIYITENSIDRKLTRKEISNNIKIR